MAQRKQAAVGPRGLRTFPEIPPERLPPPPPGPAIRMRSVQVVLLRRLLRSLSIVAVSVAGIVVVSVIGQVINAAASIAGFFLAVLIAVFVLALTVGMIGTFWTLRIAWRLRRHAWTHYAVTDLQIWRESPTTMSLIDGATRHRIKIRSSKRAETLRGLIRLDVWYAGDPTKRGILTPAGGGELLWAIPGPLRPTRKPSKPRRVKPFDPEKSRRRPFLRALAPCHPGRLRT